MVTRRRSFVTTTEGSNRRRASEGHRSFVATSWGVTDVVRLRDTGSKDPTDHHKPLL